MSIMEKNLPITESLGEGDKVRIVTSEGNSRNIELENIGNSLNNIMIIPCENDGSLYTLGKTWQEIYDHTISGGLAIVDLNTSEAYYLIIVSGAYGNQNSNMYDIDTNSLGGPYGYTYRTYSPNGYPEHDDAD